MILPQIRYTRIGKRLIVMVANDGYHLGTITHNTLHFWEEIVMSQVLKVSQFVTALLYGHHLTLNTLGGAKL